MCSTNVTSISFSPLDDEQWSALVQRAVAAVADEQAVSERLNQNQRGRSWALGMSESPSRPAWTSRRRWLGQVSAVLRTRTGVDACLGQRVAASKVLASANAMAAVAESKTGRRVTQTNKRLADAAGVTEPVFRRARRVLRELELAYEVARGRPLTTAEYRAALAHHGDRQHRAASTWALSSPAYAVRLLARERSTVYPQHPGGEHLSLLPPVREVSPVGKNFTTRAGARGPRKREPMPRPLHAQKAAARIVARITRLRVGRRDVFPGQWHIGHLVDLLGGLGIDTERWDGDAIVERLNLDSVRRNRVMPTSLRSPLGWLRVRLQDMDWNVPTPRESALAAARRCREESAARWAEISAAQQRASAPNSPIRRHAVANWRTYCTSVREA